jgi:ABC-type multidrug transport system ATPase subunit
VLTLVGVGKRYGRGDWVLSDVDLQLPPAMVAAITGRNGSGKSTLLRMLVGVSRPSLGRITGRPDPVGYVPDRFPATERLSALAYLTHLGRVRGLTTAAARARAADLLDRLSLVGGPHTPLRLLSKGNVQKVALAQALLIRPALLVLDEPWSGLDATSHGVLAEIIAEVAAGGGTVVFTDHRESVTRANAAQVHLIEGGRLSRLSTLPSVAAAAMVLLSGNGNHSDTAAALPGVLATMTEDGLVRVEVAERQCDALLLAALRAGWSVREVRRTPAVAPVDSDGREQT